jgi:hypothetical protein
LDSETGSKVLFSRAKLPEGRGKGENGYFWPKIATLWSKCTQSRNLDVKLIMGEAPVFLGIDSTPVMYVGLLPEGHHAHLVRNVELARPVEVQHCVERPEIKVVLFVNIYTIIC